MLTPNPNRPQENTRVPKHGLFRQLLSEDKQHKAPKKIAHRLTSEYYQRTSQRYIILPFVFLFFILLSSFGFYDLIRTVKKDISDTQTLNQLLAQTAAMRQTSLLGNQIDRLIDSRPMIKSIVFYPIILPQSHILQDQSVKSILFDENLGVSTPVYLEDNINKVTEETNQNLIGYIHTTLDLNHIRKTWLIKNIPICAGVTILAVCILLLALSMVKKITNRLPFLERLSQDALDLNVENLLNNDIDRIMAFANQTNAQAHQKSSRWIFEKALMHLLSYIRVQNYRFGELDKELKLSHQTASAQAIERSKIQNTLILEVKMALKRIQAGLQLIANHYVSQEQEDAIGIIRQGAEELSQKMDQIIQFQRMERGQVGIEEHRFDPDELVNNLLAKYAKLAEQKNLDLTYKKHYTTYALKGDTQKITTILASFIENALQYTEQGHIEIISRIYHLEESLRWELRVNDTGIGIEQVHLQAIFDPFFQVNPDMYAAINLMGVDLSLVKKLAGMMGADIEVKSEIGVGSSFGVTFMVNDWTKHFDRILFQGKSLVLFSQTRIYQSLQKKLEVAGAEIEGFDDTQLLMNYLALHQVDALLIATDYPSDITIALVASIRASEQMHRMTIIYYYLENASPDFEALRAAGVDYFEIFRTVDDNQDYYLKSLYHFLS